MNQNTESKITDYLYKLNMPFDNPEKGMWIIHDEFQHIDNLVISYMNPLIVFRVRLMNIPKNNKEEFYEKLLKLNASSLVHGAYAIEENYIVIVDTLEAENIDLNEFLASIDSIILAIQSDYHTLSKYLT